MTTVPAQEIKRRGISSVDKALEDGPVSIIKNNRPRYVVLTDSAYEDMIREIAEARIAASEADVKAGRVRKGSAETLLRQIRRT